MRTLRRLALGLVVVFAVLAIANEVTSAAPDVAHGTPVAAELPTSTSVAAAAKAPARVTTTTVAPTTTTVAPATTSTTAAPAPKPAPVAPRKAPTPSAAPATAAPAEAPAPAPAAEPTTPEGKGQAALDLISYPWQKLGYSVTYTGENPGLLGKANCSTHQITIYVRSSQTVRQVAFVTAFELGHAVDCGLMNDQKRNEWAQIRGFAPGWTWFPNCLCTEDNYGSGDISMVFANWLVPNGGYRWRSNLAGPPPSMDPLIPYLQA
ncbi:MAG: hypothetical protein QOD30_2350 [Actinomycetota bacterium]|jgi:hypothetical protein|nr:hypothetical protein [Actinomycetota bacterium]